MNCKSGRSQVFLSCIIFMTLIFFPYLFWVSCIVRNNIGLFYIFLVPVAAFFLMRHQQLKFESCAGISASASFKAINIFTITGMFVYVLTGLLKWHVFETFSFSLILYGMLAAFYSKEKAELFLFPCFFMIFFYPWELLLSGLVPLLNTFHILAVHSLISMTGFYSEYNLSTFQIILPGFVMNVIPACSGLDLSVVCIMFLSIYAWHSGMRVAAKTVFMASIPVIVILVNTCRIFFLTFSGMMKFEFFSTWAGHSAASLLVLVCIFLCLKAEEYLLLKMQKFPPLVEMKAFRISQKALIA